MDQPFNKIQDGELLDYRLEDPEQLPSPSTLIQFSSDISEAVVDHGVTRSLSDFGDHDTPASHCTTPTSAHLPPLPTIPILRNQRTRHERVIPERVPDGIPAMRTNAGSPQLQLLAPTTGYTLYGTTPSAAPSVIQAQLYWLFPNFSTEPLNSSTTEAMLGTTDVIGLELGATPDDDTNTITPLSTLSGTTPTIDFDSDFHSPSWGLAWILPSPSLVREGPAHPRGTIDDKSDKSSFGADNDDSSIGRPPTIARERVTKGKQPVDSIDGASNSGTDDTRPLPDPDPSSIPDVEFAKPSLRSYRLMRAKSVATTASASPSAAAASTPSRADKPPATAARLRSASHVSKNGTYRPSESPKECRTRASHNVIEKRYRSRLNAQFEGLLSALPELPPRQQQLAAAKALKHQGEWRVSKAEVLERARRHIKSLEEEREALRRRREELQRHLAIVEQDVDIQMGEVTLRTILERSPVAVEDEEPLDDEGR